MRHPSRPLPLPRACVVGFLGVAAVLIASPQAQVSSPPPAERVFEGRQAEIEAFLKTAAVVRYESLSLGITRPLRAWLAPGGPCASVAWKPLRPGMYKGFWESYKSEIAAYEADKLLQLNMVPPTVERELNGVRGAMVMWLEGLQMWRDVDKTRPVTRYWNTQVVRMNMFDAFIGNSDRNAGNILIDGNWTMHLIDHSRAFAFPDRTRIKLAQVDAALWDRMRALDEKTLRDALGEWIDRASIRAMLDRRERMQKQIDELVKKRGEGSVYIR